LLLPGDPPSVPEVFPGQFFDEHFWFAAGANLTPANGGVALLVLAVEGAFVADVVPGGQITFSRIRVRLDPVPADGTYRFIHPYGVEVITAATGDRIFFTDDVGFTCPPGTFDCAMQSRLGPFLLPSATAGGAELPPVSGPVPGKLYIADPNRVGPVTGSPLGTNLFRIEGPLGSNLGGPGVDFIETTDFSLMGRVFQGEIASQLTIKRASYARPSTPPNKVDVYATAIPAISGRLPGNPAPALVSAQLSYFDAPCTPTLDADGNPGPPFTAPAGAIANEMIGAGSKYFGQSHPAAIPPEVCVQTNAVDAAGQTVLIFLPVSVGDQVFITEALFDPASQSLSVKATSSDELVPQTLTVEGLGTIDPTTGRLLVNPLLAPPESVEVLSSGRGHNLLQVSTGPVAGGGTVIVPVAFNDTATILEDTLTPTPINVLVNDVGASGGTVSLVSSPLKGSAVLNADGTFDYTPTPNASGTDTFTYTVTVGTQVSNAASVTVTITPVNDAPTAVNDNATAFVGVTTPINVLANDTDPDGQADLAAAVIVAWPAQLGTNPGTVIGGIVNVTPTAAGTFSFTYLARDAAGVLSSLAATVTVTVAGGETITIQVAELRANGGRYRVSGTVTPAAGQTMTIQLRNAAGTVLRTNTAVAVAGAWAIDIRNVTAPAGNLTVLVTSPNGGAATANVVRRQ